MDKQKTYYQEIGKRIKKARDAVGLSQAELGKAIGVSDTAVSMYEKGDRYISIKMLNSIAKTLAITLEELAQGYLKAPDISYALRADEKLREDPRARKEILNFIDWVKHRTNERQKSKAG